MTATLKKSLGEGGAFVGDSHGEDNLHAVLKALAEGGSQSLNAIQATVAAGIIGALLTDVATKLSSLRIAVGTTGSAGQTDVVVNLDGTAQTGTATVLNTDANGTKDTVTFDPPIDVPAGTLVEIEVTAAPTAGADLTASAHLSNVTVEP